MTAGHGPTKAKQRFSSFLEKLGCSLELVAVYAAKNAGTGSFLYWRLEKFSWSLRTFF